MRTILQTVKLKKALFCALGFLLGGGMMLLSTSCDDEKDYSRAEYIEWSSRSDFDKSREPGSYHCPLRGFPEGETGKIFIRSNVDYTAVVEFGEDEQGRPVEPWFHIEKIERGYAPGVDLMTFRVDAYLGVYKERFGCISLKTDVPYLNEFITVIQGFVPRVQEGDFNWLAYGPANPYDTSLEKPISEWSAAQLEHGWESVPAVEGGEAYCFGKNGYLRLGDDQGHGANLRTPYFPAIKSDTVALVSFNAVAYTSREGVEDAARLRVRVLDGGAFDDGKTERVIEVKHMNPAASPVEVTMWEDSVNDLLIYSFPKNRFSSSTRVEIMAGEFEGNAPCSRIFIDNFHVFRLRWYDYASFFETLPWETENTPNL